MSKICQIFRLTTDQPTNLLLEALTSELKKQTYASLDLKGKSDTSTSILQARETSVYKLRLSCVSSATIELTVKFC